MKNLRVLFLIGVILSVKPSRCGAQKIYEEALNEFLLDHKEQAIVLFTNSIQANQEVGNSYMYRGASKTKLKLFADALKDLDSAKRIMGENYKLDFYYGKYFGWTGLYDSALHYANLAISKNPNDADSYDERAAIKGFKKKFEDALLDEEHAIRLNSNKALFFLNRGWIKYSLKLNQDAILDYDKALNMELKPIIYGNRGLAFAALGRYKEAIADYTTALIMLPTNPEVQFRRGEAYREIGKVNEACADFTKSAELGYIPATAEKEKICK